MPISEGICVPKTAYYGNPIIYCVKHCVVYFIQGRKYIENVGNTFYLQMNIKLQFEGACRVLYEVDGLLKIGYFLFF